MGPACGMAGRRGQPPSTQWPAGSLLASLGSSARAQLMGLGTTQRYDRPRTLIREGERTTEVILLRSAVAKVTGRSENGRECLLAIRVSGDTVGELAALDKMPRSATIATCGPATVDLISGAKFEAFLSRTPEAAMAVNRMIISRLRAATRRRIDLGGYPVRVRLARVIAELAAAHGRPQAGGVAIGVALTQRELGELVAAADITIHKQLRWMKTQGIITTGYRKITICNFERLDSIQRMAD